MAKAPEPKQPDRMTDALREAQRSAPPLASGKKWDAPKHPGRKTGAIPTPRHKLLAAEPHRPRGAATPRAIVVPSFLEMWLNDQDGDCVTAEEAAAIAFYSTMLGLPEVKILDATVQAFCDQFGFLNGANLTDVMDKMISDGFKQDMGYKDGPYKGVDYSNESVLQSAIELGPVKIGIDSSALPSGAGNGNGWYASGGSPGQFSNEDHCVGLWNYGSAADLFAALKTPVPSGFPESGYHLYTWSTVGVVDHAWIMSTCGEAWLRSPTDVSFGPAPTPTPTPTPPPTPTPTPPPTPTPTPPMPTTSHVYLDGTLPAGIYPLASSMPVELADAVRALQAGSPLPIPWTTFLSLVMAWLQSQLALDTRRRRR